MGLFSDAKAITDVQKIKNGGTAELSISQITNLIINLPDAQRKLTPAEFQAVHGLYKQMRKCKTKLQMDMDGYLDTVVKIIREFDQIAPYEKYSGGNEIESSFMMQDIRKDTENSSNIQDYLKSAVDESGNGNNEYINHIVETGYQISYDDAKAFLGILILHEKKGKAEALAKFDLLVKYWIDSSDAESVLLSIGIPFFCGALFPNGVVTKEESDVLSEKYSNMAINKILESHSAPIVSEKRDEYDVFVDKYRKD